MGYTTHMITLNSIEPEYIFKNHDDLEHNLVVYLTKHIEDDATPPPTPEGLARSVGFTSFMALRDSIKKFYDTHRLSADLLLAACSTVLDYYQQKGLTDSLSQQFIKFLSSAYFGVSEKQVTESRSTISQSVTITINSHQPESLEEEIEFLDLEDNMKQLQAVERQNISGSTHKPHQ
jgi:hypothetical protein